MIGCKQNMTNIRYYMEEAYKQALLAEKMKDVPVGCVIVKDNEIISRAYNRRESDANSLHHAEILAIDEACKNLGDWRLQDCSMFVTLEPCLMCAGAILNSRLSKLYFGAWDVKNGAAGSALNVMYKNNLSHTVETYGGIMFEECNNLLLKFFRNIR